MKTIDINCDLGESYGAWKMGNDDGVMPHITSANVACGFHGGDPATIRRTVLLAVQNGVAVGAHPSLPDLMGFGRRAMTLTADEAYDLVIYQAGAVQAFARAAGATLHHVKCHGALYNMAAMNEDLSDAIGRAVRDLGGGTMLYALSGSRMMDAGLRLGVRTVAEVFADRSYQDDGTLTPRTKPGAMIESEAAAVAQAVGMVEQGTLTSQSGKTVKVDAGTICLHGDQPGAVSFAIAVRAAFKARNIRVAAP
ncbi:MAG: LamB/YcsF family protein [Betaproteobacteria bacterium]|nr:LamB/YcsF family protein [Betaproteobacteria bacterium]